MTSKAPRKTGSRSTAGKSSAAKNGKISLASLNTALIDLEKRLKQADSVTRRSVTSLKKIVEALEEKAENESLSYKADLTGYVNRVSERLRAMIVQTREEVSVELRQALQNPDADHVGGALDRADSRLRQAEQVQADAISKINRHLANLATAMDSRIKAEAAKQQAALDAASQKFQEKFSKVEGRIGSIEQDSAKALTDIGAKVSTLTEEINLRDSGNEALIDGKISAFIESRQAALESEKSELDKLRAGLESKLEEISQSDRADISRLERQMQGLSSRLEGLEYGISDAMALFERQMPPATGGLAPVINPVQAAPFETSHEHEQEQPQQQAHSGYYDVEIPQPVAPLTQDQPILELHNHEMSALAGNGSPIAYQAAPNPATQPGPVPFVPPTTMAAPTPPPMEPVPKQFPAVPPITDRSLPAQQNPFAQNPPSSIPQAPAAPAPTTLPFEEFSDPQYASASPDPGSGQPFSNPAYAETAQSNPVKPAGLFADKKSGNVIRLSALAASVALVAIIAGRVFLGGSPDSETVANARIEQAPIEPATDQTVSSGVSESNIEKPIGDYIDNNPQLPTGETASNGLNAAAVTGDAIAQFQLGLSYLENGRIKDGVSLIRKAADQNQPAAQYRLAKLYETGEGVPQDMGMARKLTERAANLGNRIAMHDLALYHAEGKGGLTADLTMAAKWFEKAAERGVVDSQFNLGVLYESGKGLTRSSEDAFVWYSIAAAQGDQTARKRVEALSKILDTGQMADATQRINGFQPVKLDDQANGIFKNVSWQKTSDNDDQPSQIKTVQVLLTGLGYDAGGTDGSIGPKTRAAIISFEKANNMPETGRVNSDLVNRLELASGA